MGLLVFLLRGGERNDLTISPDGTMFASTNQSEAVYAHWRAFVNQGESFLLWGADGRYRLVIPKRVLTRQDYAAVRERLGIDLTKLRSGGVDCARITRPQPVRCSNVRDGARRPESDHSGGPHAA